MIRNIDDYSLEELEAALVQTQQEPPIADNSSFALDDIPLEELERAQALQQSQKQGDDFNWARFIPERLIQSGLGVPDFLQHVGKEAIGMGGPEFRKKLATSFGEDPVQYEQKIQEALQARQPSQIVNEAVREQGLDLESQGRGNTPAQRVVGRGIEMAPWGLGGNTAAQALKGVGTAFATGTTAQGLEEAGVPPLIADIAAMIGVPAAELAALRLKYGQGLPKAQQKVSEYFKSMIGEKDLPEVTERLAKPPVYEKSKYVPMSAEVANNPAISQLHQLQYGVTGTGLPEHAGRQHDKLVSAIDKTLPAPVKEVDLKGILETKLEKSKIKRGAKVDKGYKILEKDDTPLNPEHAKKHYKESNVRGDLRKQLDYARKQIKPGERELNPEYEKYYESIEPSKREALKLKKPASKYPTVAELTAGRAAINARLEAKIGKKRSEARVLKGFIKELDKDLSVIPLHEKIIKTYEKLSRPINHIEKHPALKKLLKTRLNNQITAIMDKDSGDNIAALKKAIGKDKNTWTEIKGNITNHFIDSIQNSGAKGNSNAFSYDKFRKYTKKHEKVFPQIYNKEQLEFMNEFKDIMSGQNRAFSFAGPGSATHAKLRTDLGLRQKTGMDAADLATTGQHGVIKKGIKSLLTNWYKGKEERLMEVFNRALIEPEFLHKLITYNPKSQVDFNRFLNNALRQAPILVTGDDDDDK